MRAENLVTKPPKLTQEQRLDLICEAVRYSQAARRLNAPAADAKAVREAIFSFWETYGKGKRRGAKYRSLAANGQKSGIVYDHAVPIRMVLEKLVALDPVEPSIVRSILDTWVAATWITKAEDDLLTSLGLRSRMPLDWDGADILARYSVAGIAVEANNMAMVSEIKPKRERNTQIKSASEVKQRHSPIILQDPFDHPSFARSEDRVKQVCRSLVTALQGEGFEFRPEVRRDGFSLTHPQMQTIRIDPKVKALRVQVNHAGRLAPPAALIHQGRRANWLVVRPEDGTVATDYLVRLVRGAA